MSTIESLLDALNDEFYDMDMKDVKKYIRGHPVSRFFTEAEEGGETDEDDVPRFDSRSKLDVSLKEIIDRKSEYSYGEPVYIPMYYLQMWEGGLYFFTHEDVRYLLQNEKGEDPLIIGALNEDDDINVMCPSAAKNFVLTDGDATYRVKYLEGSYHLPIKDVPIYIDRSPSLFYYPPTSYSSRFYPSSRRY